METPHDNPVPVIKEPIEAVKTYNNIDYCLFLGIPLTSRYTRSEDFYGTILTGYSYGFYVSKRPIMRADRLLDTDVVGNKIIVENPIEYLEGLIHGTDNPCGLIKGGWDTTVTNWGTDTLPYQQFEASESATVQTQIDDIGEYCALFYMDGWKEIDGIFQPVTYLCNEANIDTQLDLPDAIEIEDGTTDIRDMRMIVDGESEINGDQQYNSVWVDGVRKGDDGNENSGYTSHKPATWDVATMGVEYPYYYKYEISPTLSITKAKAAVATKANYLYDLLTLPAETFTVQFFDRYDLKLMQKIRFIGFDKIPDVQMRITDIEYTIDGDAGIMCKCTCATERSWSAMRKLAVTLKQDYLIVANTIKDSIERRLQMVNYGTVESMGPNGTVIMKSDRTGNHSYVTIPNQA